MGATIVAAVRVQTGKATTRRRTHEDEQTKEPPTSNLVWETNRLVPTQEDF